MSQSSKGSNPLQDQEGDHQIESRGWLTEIRAILWKEALSEGRAPHALLTGALFSLIAVITISLSALNQALTPTLSAGLLWVVLLFAAVMALPRMMLMEEDLGTSDFLRITARPHAIFWGKLLFNLVQLLILAGVVGLLFVLINNATVPYGGLFILGLVNGAVAVNASVTLAGAIAARASNRYALSTAIAIPLILPISAWGVTAIRAAFGSGFLLDGQHAALGLLAYGIAASAVGPYIYAAIWKL